MDTSLMLPDQTYMAWAGDLVRRGYDWPLADLMAQRMAVDIGMDLYAMHRTHRGMRTR